MGELPEFLAAHRVEIVAQPPLLRTGGRRSPARARRLRPQLRGAPAPQRTRLREAGNVTAPPPGLQPARRLAPASTATARGAVSSRAAPRLRRRVRPPLRAREHADRALRRPAAPHRRVRALPEPPREPLQSRDGAWAHVPLAAERRPRRLTPRLRLQPHARDPAGRGPRGRPADHLGSRAGDRPPGPPRGDRAALLRLHGRSGIELYGSARMTAAMLLVGAGFLLGWANGANARFNRLTRRSRDAGSGAAPASCGHVAGRGTNPHPSPHMPGR